MNFLTKLLQGIIPGLRLDFVRKEKIPSTVEECQKEMFCLYTEKVDHTPAIEYALKVVAQWPIEKGYVLYYDIAKGCGEEGRRFEWLFYTCSLLMYNHKFHGRIFKEAKHRSYFDRLLKIVGLSHHREQLQSVCERVMDQEALFRHIEIAWADRQRPPLPKKSDPLLDKARAFVKNTGNCDPGILRFNVGRYAIGYNRAVNLIDALEKDGTILPEDNPTWQ